MPLYPAHPSALLLGIVLALVPAAPVGATAPVLGTGPAVNDGAQEAAAEGLLGAWISNGDDGERLEFLPGGAVVVDGARGRFSARGERLELSLGGRKVRATYRLEAGELRIALPAEAGARQASYRRAEAPLKLTVGPAMLRLPAGWAVVRRAGDTVVVDPLGDRSGAAWLLVAGEPLDASLKGGQQPTAQAATAALDAALPGLTAELAREGVTLERHRPRARALAAEGPLSAAEAQLQGRAADGRAVAVWAGLARGADGTVTAVLVAEAARSEALVGAARKALTGATFAPPAPRTATPSKPAGDLAGLEFGHSSFGSDASLTTVYRFGPNGRLIRRTMFSSPLGGTDSEAHGTYSVSGDRVTLSVDGERITATVVREGAQVTALRIGRASYSRL